MSYDFKVYTLTLGCVQTNCRVVAFESGNAVVIDPAGETEAILSLLEEKGLTVVKILLTHGHFDHTGACVSLKEKTGAEIYIHEKDEELLEDGEKALAFFDPRLVYVPFKADALLNDGDTVEQDDCVFRVMHTPGHTPGSVCYILGEHIFAGDTVFAGSVGRTDCYGGNFRSQCESLKRLAALHGEYIIHPGHGEDTTLYDELCGNPFFVKYAR